MEKNPIKKVTLAWFSGTGGTALAAECFEKQLTELGMEINKIKIACDTPSIIKNTDLLIVLSPVYAFRLASIVEKWIKKLPDANNTPVALIAVSGGGELSPNTACRLPCRRILQKKGFQVQYEQMIVMPSNFADPTPEDLAVQLLHILPSKVESMTKDILSGKKNLIRPKMQDRIFIPIGKAEHLGAKFFGKSLHTTSACSKCGLCMKNCPQKNISLKNGKIQFGFQCIWCLKCVYSCPSKAISPRMMKFVVLKDGLDIRKLKERADNYTESSNEPEKKFLWEGIVKYLKD